MVAAKVQQAVGHALIADANVSATLASPASAGNLLVACLGYRGTSTSHSNPSGWTLHANVAGPGFDGGRQLLYTKVAVGGETSLTIGCSAHNKDLYLAEWSGVGDVDVVDFASNVGASSSLTTDALTPTVAGGVIFAGFNQSARNPSIAMGGGFTEDWDEDVDASGPSVVFGHLIDSTFSGSYTATATSSHSKGYGWFIVSFAEATIIPAEFSGTPTSGNAPLEVDFTDETGGTPTTWAWTFGDGGTSTSQNPTHIYTSPGVYTVTLLVNGVSFVTRTNYITVTSPGAVIGDPGAFVTLPWQDIVSWRINFDGSQAVGKGNYTGTAVVRLVNRNDRYNPENESSDIIDKLRDGTRIWLGINEDGTIAPDDAKTVYGQFAGRIRSINVETQGGTGIPQFVEFDCLDAISWLFETPVVIVASRLRSHFTLRTDILNEAAQLAVDLAPEPMTMPLSYGEGTAGELLAELNLVTGTRHYAKPADDPETWYTYTTVRRTQKLSGVADVTIDADADVKVSPPNWETNAETVVNQQRATIEPAYFTTYQMVVWESEDVPFPASSRPELLVEFDDYVEGAIVAMNFTGTVGVGITNYGLSALIALTGSGTVTSLRVLGSLTRRGVAETIIIDDEDSQDPTRGIRESPEISSDYLGTIRGAHAIASHVVWRYADPKRTPDLQVTNWIPEQFTTRMYDVIAFSSDQIGVASRLFEVIGIEHSAILAARPDAVLHYTTFKLFESRVQAPFGWFTLDDSLLDGDDVLAY